MDHVAALQKQSLLVHSCSPFLSQGACWTKEPTEERLHTSETMFSAPQRLCTFWKGSHYYSAGDFKRFPSSFWCSLMHSHAQLSELQNHWVCLYNQSPANPHDYRNGTLAHTLSSWQSDTVPPPPPRCIPFPHHYSMTRMGDSVFFKGPLWWHTLNLVHLLWVYELYTVKSITNPFKVAETVALLTVWKYS